MLATRDPVWATAAVVLSLVTGHAALYSVQGSLIPELFGTRLRYSGALIGYQLSAVSLGRVLLMAETSRRRLDEARDEPARHEEEHP